MTTREYQLLPVEPTAEMGLAGLKAAGYLVDGIDLYEIYAAMVGAAPQNNLVAELEAEVRSLRRWKELVSCSSLLQAARDKAERDRNHLQSLLARSRASVSYQEGMQQLDSPHRQTFQALLHEIDETLERLSREQVEP